MSIHRRSSAKAAHRLTTWADEVFGKDRIEVDHKAPRIRLMNVPAADLPDRLSTRTAR